MKHVEICLRVLTVVALMACDKSADGKQAGSAEKSIDSVKEQACACKTEDCADRALAELTIQRRHFEETFEEANACVAKVKPLAGADEILQKMTAFKDQMCKCRDKTCVEQTEKDMMEWAMKNMEKMKDMKPTKAQEEIADKLDDEMDRCKERVEGAGLVPTP